MKNIKQHIKALVVITIFVQATSCLQQREKYCILVNKPTEIKFEDSTLYDIRISPFEEGKIWVKESNKNNDIWEIDNSSGQKSILDQQKYKCFFATDDNGRHQYHHKDQYDEIVWIACSGRNVLYYDQRTKVIQELPVGSVIRIISRPNEVFFVTRQGFCYWDRKTKAILNVSGIPLGFIQSSVMPNDTTIILDAAYTYFFNSKQVKKGIFFNEYEHLGQWSSFKVSDGAGLYSKDHSLWYFYEGVRGKLPLPYEHIDNTKILNQKYWQSDDKFYYSFDPKSNKVNKYAYRLPNVNNYALHYQIDARYIWILKSGQVMLIRLLDNKQFEYPIQSEEGHIKTIFDECNVYSLYKNKLIITSKEDFIKRCLPFDAQQYDLDLKRFEFVVDSIGILKDTIPSIALSKLNYLKERYSTVTHVELRRNLNEMNLRAFHSISYRFPDDYVECYRDESMPIPQRKICLKSLVDEYGQRLSNFNKVIYLEQEFIKYFGKPDRENDYYFSSEVDSVKIYLSEIDSLQKTTLSADSLYYFKTLALESICRTHWYCGEGCGGCDFSLVTDKLKSLPVKYPQSQLIDNAMFYLLESKYRYDYGEEESLIAHNQEYEVFLKEYPDSDLRADIQFYVFLNWVSMQNLDPVIIKATAKRFIVSFGSDKRIVEVKQRLADLNIK